MKNKKNVPDIRFKGFIEKWKFSNLENLVELFSGLTYSPTSIRNEGTLVLRSSNVKDGIIVNADNVYVASEFVNSDYVVFGDIIVVVRNGSRSLIGKHAMVDRIMNNTVIGAFMTGLRYKQPEFLNALLYTKQFDSEIAKNLGATINQITNGALKSMCFTIPQGIDEQQAIGNYFQNIDRLINTSQTKLDKLKNIKKACLEKMFPRNSSTTPELRFKGFSEEWEICELKDICVIKTGYPFNSMDFSNDGDFRVITNGNIQDNSAIVDNLSGNKVNIYNKQIIEEYGLNIGDVLVTMDGTVGRSAKVADDYMILAQRVGRLIAVNNTEFLYQLLNASSFYKEMTAISVGGTIKHISLSDIGSYSTSIPTDVNEQIQLGIFFRNLDDLIAKTEQQINKLKNIKKACLDKMFVKILR